MSLREQRKDNAAWDGEARMVPQRGRPAEKAGAGAGLVVVIAAAVGASTTLVAVLAGVAGALPAVVTYLKVNGGVRGVLRSLWGS